MGKQYSFKYIRRNSSHIFNIFLFFYLIFGFYLSVNTGISTDEFIEQKNWKFNLEAIKDFFGSSNDGYLNLLKYEWKFHGVGFHYFSHIYWQFLLDYIYHKVLYNQLKDSFFLFQQ